MDIEHFLKSAHAVAGVLMDSQFGLAQKIFRSVQVTRQVVSTNTNLGIVLLCVPIVQACIQLPNKTLRQSIQDEIEGLDIDDAQLILDAIQLADPSGLGTSEVHDVFEPASAPVRVIMSHAKDKDLIARQYACGYTDIFGKGFDTIDRLLELGLNESEVVTAVFLFFLGEHPDTHIVRQHGSVVAAEIQREAVILFQEFQDSIQERAMLDQLLRFDSEWKSREINPGTSADLTVATLFAHSIVNEVN